MSTESASEPAFVTVVSGLPRSGTSMMMQMIAASGLPILTDDARVPDRSNPRGYFEHEAVKRLARESGFVSSASGMALKVVSPLLPRLPSGPHYRIVLMKRDLDEVLRSQARMMGGAAANSPADREGEDGILRAAFTKSVAQARAWIENDPNTLGLEIEHGEALCEPLQVARRVAEFLGRSSETDALASMAAAVDTSLYRTR